MKDLLSKGALESPSPGPVFYSLLFITPKVTGGWRPVINLSRLNHFVQLSHFHMETAQSVFQFISPGDWMISLDLQDAYLQVPVHPESRRFLHFFLGDTTYQFRVLCFGLSSTPQVFTRVMSPVSSIMHRFGFRILHYLDDWFVLGSSLPEIEQARDFFLTLCSELGIQVNLSKSSLTPSQRQDYLGMALQSSPLRAFPTQAWVQKVLSLVDEFSSLCVQPLSLWRSLLGVMSSLSTLIPGSRLQMRALQHRLHVSHPQDSPTEHVSWDDSCRGDLRWWSDPSYLIVRGDLSLPHLEFLLFTDASDMGWGASLGSDHLSSLWSPDVFLFSINHRELLAVYLANRGYLHLIRGRSMSLFTYNTTALSYLCKEGGTRSSTLNSVAQEILRLCESNGVRLLQQFVPGHLGVLADSLSRSAQILSSEWTLCMDVCLELFRHWPVTVDLLATSLNRRLQVYFLPMVDPKAAAVDAMIQSWDHLQTYAFPPFGLIQRVLSKVRSSRNLEVTLVASFWLLRPWFLDLLDLLVDVPVLLPQRRDLLHQPHFHQYHRSLRTLELTGFRITSDPRTTSASLQEWLANLPSPEGRPLV